MISEVHDDIYRINVEMFFNGKRNFAAVCIVYLQFKQ
jgi:hypothetical protein